MLHRVHIFLGKPFFFEKKIMAGPPPPYCPLTPIMNSYLLSDFPGAGVPAWYDLSGNTILESGAIAGAHSYSGFDALSSVAAASMPLAPTFIVPIYINFSVDFFNVDFDTVNARVESSTAELASPCSVTVRCNSFGEFGFFDISDANGTVSHRSDFYGIDTISNGVHQIQLRLYRDAWQCFYDGVEICDRPITFVTPPSLIQIFLTRFLGYTHLNEIWVVGDGLPTPCGGSPPVSGGRFGRRCGCSGGF